MLTHPARGVQAYVGTVDIFARDPKVGVQQLVLSLPFAIISLPFAAFPQRWMRVVLSLPAVSLTNALLGCDHRRGDADVVADDGR